MKWNEYFNKFFASVSNAVGRELFLRDDLYKCLIIREKLLSTMIHALIENIVAVHICTSIEYVSMIVTIISYMTVDKKTTTTLVANFYKW